MYLFYKASMVLNYIEAFIAVSAWSHKMSQKNSLLIVAEIKPSKLGRSPKNSHHGLGAWNWCKCHTLVDFHQLLSIALQHHAGLVK